MNVNNIWQYNMNTTATLSKQEYAISSFFDGYDL